MSTEALTYMFIILLNLNKINGQEYILGDAEVKTKAVMNVERIVYKIRCTRRFNPGNCIEPVRPVWTFTYQNQNCSERLGCQSAIRSNRFPTYRSCIRNCRPLLNSYMQILSHDKQSIGNSSNYRKMADNAELDMKSLLSVEDINAEDKNTAQSTVDIEGFYKEGYKYDEDYKKQEEEESVFPPDIDDVDTKAESDSEELVSGEK